MPFVGGMLLPAGAVFKGSDIEFCAGMPFGIVDMIVDSSKG